MEKICEINDVLSIVRGAYHVQDDWCIFCRDGVVYGVKLSYEVGVNAIDMFKRNYAQYNLVYSRPYFSSDEIAFLRRRFEEISPEQRGETAAKVRLQSAQKYHPMGKIQRGETFLTFSEEDLKDATVGDVSNKMHIRMFLAPIADIDLENGRYYVWGEHLWCYCDKALFYNPQSNLNKSLRGRTFWINGCLRRFHKREICMLNKDAIKTLWDSIGIS